MRSLLVLVLLTGCATQPPVSDEQARAIVSYYNARCVKEGVDPNDAHAMSVCRVVNYEKDTAPLRGRDCHSYGTIWGTNTTCR